MKRKTKKQYGVVATRGKCARHGDYLETILYVGDDVKRAGCPRCKRRRPDRRKADGKGKKAASN